MDGKNVELEQIGFIGLGQLGLPVATNLLDAGYPLRVYNRTASKADSLVAQGAQLAASPADTVTPGGVVATLVWDDAALESIVMSDGFLDRLGEGGIHLSMSTISPDTSKRLAAIHTQHGSVYVDATIFGGPTAAVAHELWIPLAGPEQAKVRVRPLLTAMGAQGIFDLGEEIGAAAITKLLGNFLIISASRSLYEALALARNYGVDPRVVIDMLTHSLFSAPIYRSYGARIAEGGAPFIRTAIPLKDIGTFQQLAREVVTPAPIADLLADILRDSTAGTASR